MKLTDEQRKAVMESIGRLLSVRMERRVFEEEMALTQAVNGVLSEAVRESVRGQVINTLQQAFPDCANLDVVVSFTGGNVVIAPANAETAGLFNAIDGD